MTMPASAASASLPLDPAAAWEALRAQGSRLRQVNVAAELGISEGALVGAHVGTRAVPLNTHWLAQLQGLEAVGPVTALTRNRWCVIEKTGTYQSVSGGAHMGIAIGPDIDLRLFFSRWHAGFAFYAPTGRGDRWSVQYFDAAGQALHKIFLESESDGAAFEAWRAQHAAATDPRFDAEAVPATHPPAPLDAAQRDTLLQGWRELADTHDFFPLLRRVGAHRLSALRAAEGEFAFRLEPRSYRPLLERAAATGLSIMVFVGNPGLIEIHTGPVQRVREVSDWYNVLDPGFNLHLQEDGVAEAWLVLKPTSDGDVTSVELFDAEGETIVMFFGERKPGRPELEPWRALAHDLPRLPS